MKQAIVSRLGSEVILTNPAFSDTVVTSEWFEPAFWSARGQLLGSAHGRGSVAMVGPDQPKWAVRHYQRGGLVGRFNRDRYLYTGHQRVRAVSEFSLLRQLAHWGLPSCAPLAARYRRYGAWYRADLITAYVPHQQTLAQFLAGGPIRESELVQRLGQVGEAVGRFQAKGVRHADLNCHNILLGEAAVTVIDFDRGAVMAAGDWQQATLKRLLRSALKISPAESHGLISVHWTRLQQAELKARQAIP